MKADMEKPENLCFQAFLSFMCTPRRESNFVILVWGTGICFGIQECVINAYKSIDICALSVYNNGKKGGDFNKRNC